MSVPLHNQVRAGTLVSIVLKQDQRTGRQVQGSVSQVLTRGNHPRGVKVRLTDGRIGRVQQLVGESTTTHSPQISSQAPKKYYRKMADQNPWASESQNSPYGASNQHQNLHQYSQQPQQDLLSGSPPQQRFYGEQQSQPPQQQSYSTSQDYYNAPPGPPPSSDNPWGDATGNPPLPARNPAHNLQQPSQGISRRDTDDLLAQEPDRGEQYEHMQAYEATASISEDDKNRAQLEKEFPDVDGSLIAALYGDTKDLSATREMLQELGRQ